MIIYITYKISYTFLIISVIVIELYILDKLPEKKHVSSPNLGLYDAHFGAVNSTIATRNDKIKGNP